MDIFTQKFLTKLIWLCWKKNDHIDECMTFLQNVYLNIFYKSYNFQNISTPFELFIQTFISIINFVNIFFICVEIFFAFCRKT